MPALDVVVGIPAVPAGATVAAGIGAVVSAAGSFEFEEPLPQAANTSALAMTGTSNFSFIIRPPCESTNSPRTKIQVA
ncbi:MAG TPA: hypothetical protein VF284_04255 [Rhodanobacteraceae bacterium]